MQHNLDLVCSDVTDLEVVKTSEFEIHLVDLIIRGPQTCIKVSLTDDVRLKLIKQLTLNSSSSPEEIKAFWFRLNDQIFT